MNVFDLAETLVLQPVTALAQPQQMRLLEIRNQPGVRQFMYTSHVIDEEEHRCWIGGLEDDSSRVAMGVLQENRVVGFAGLSAYSKQHGRADWGFYVDAEEPRRGLGTALSDRFLDFSFAMVDKLNGEVLDYNQASCALHRKLGFQQEGIRRNHIVRDGKTHDAVLFGITKAEWADRRARLGAGETS